MAATYQAESFYRAKISSSIASAQSCPITIRVSKLPSRSSGLLTISPNTENEEIVEYSNPNATNMTIDITKRGVNPASGLLTTAGTDYNNPSFQRDHAQNEIIRGDVNHIHINQSVANTVLASNTTVGISKLSVAAADPNDPIAVGTNDPRLTAYVAPKASNTTLGDTKLSVAPNDANNPIAVGDNDPRLSLKIQQGSGQFTPSTGVETITLGWRPKRIRIVAVNRNNYDWGRSDAHIYEDDGVTKVNVQCTYSQEVLNGPVYQKSEIYLGDNLAIRLRWEHLNHSSGGAIDASVITRGITITSTGFTLATPNYIRATDQVRYYWEAIG